jgi:hypothetical protein
MRLRVLGILIVLPLMLAGCGDSDSDDTGAAGDPSAGSSTVCAGQPAPPEATVDLDGDGTADAVRVDDAVREGTCADSVVAEINGTEVVAAMEYGLPVSAGDMSAVRLPGRTGDLLLITAQHPRGGFQAILYGYADGRLEELTAGGAGLFPFVATDSLSDPLSARCVENGFEILRARAHEPAGVVHAWDIDRTTYTLDGNTVTKGAPTKVADNVLDKQLHRTYRPLTRYSLFANCRVDR